MISLLDYGAGNIRSLKNAIHALGFKLTEVKRPEDILAAKSLIFPGVGAFGAAILRLKNLGYLEVLKEYLAANRPFLGICIGLQILFEGSEESPGIPGLGVIPGQIRRFPVGSLAVPHIGWNGLHLERPSRLLAEYSGEKVYFVHSYRAELSLENQAWWLAITEYGDDFLSAVQRGNISAVQFHPEKSGAIGLTILRNFLDTSTNNLNSNLGNNLDNIDNYQKDKKSNNLAKRIIACLDVRTNDAGDLVVTKGDQYDVREAGQVRNLGKPVALAERYYQEGADEIAFLNITAFRDYPLADQPMLEVLRQASERVFVPLTIGGGIRAFTDQQGKEHSALAVADAYFRAGADKVSLGSDAVFAVEKYLANQKIKDGSTAIEQIAQVYGKQAVVISIDPRRVYVLSPTDTNHVTIATKTLGPNGERYCWFQCTVKGGREGREIDAITLAKICEELGAGEILLNSIDRDGTRSGFDLELIYAVHAAVSIPVIASSGAGCIEHFAELFKSTKVEAALAAGIFHRREVPIQAVKDHLRAQGIEIRSN